MPKNAKKPDSWFVKKLRELGACGRAVRYAQTHRTFPAAWQNCENVDWLMWLVRSLDLIPDHRAFISNCPGCKWEKQNDGITASQIRRRFTIERVSKALRKAAA